MKYLMRRQHTVRPEDYESIGLIAQVEIDTESEIDKDFRDMEPKEIGDELSAVLDEVLDSDVNRALRSEGQHIEDTHLWAFYEKG